MYLGLLVKRILGPPLLAPSSFPTDVGSDELLSYPAIKAHWCVRKSEAKQGTYVSGDKHHVCTISLTSQKRCRGNTNMHGEIFPTLQLQTTVLTVVCDALRVATNLCAIIFPVIQPLTTTLTVVCDALRVAANVRAILVQLLSATTHQP